MGDPRQRGDPEASSSRSPGSSTSSSFPYHQAILNDEIPLSIGGGIGQSRTYMLLLRKAHLGEVSVTVWPQDPQGHVRRRKNIHVLE